jgi:hypothetical protein
MLGGMLAHGGDASGLGMLAFFPVGLLLLVGIILALRPAMTTRPPEPEEDDRPAQDGERETDDRHGRT